MDILSPSAAWTLVTECRIFRPCRQQLQLAVSQPTAGQEAARDMQAARASHLHADSIPRGRVFYQGDAAVTLAEGGLSPDHVFGVTEH